MAETLNTFEESTGAEPAEHTQAMLEKAEQLEKNNDPNRPEWLPEKFQSPEAMAQAYSALERKLGSGEEQTEQEDYEDYDDEDVDLDDLELAVDSETNEVSQALDNVGLDFNAFQEEYFEQGGLSAEAYEALDDAGFPRNLVDSWIAGQEALGAQVQSQVFNSVGGEQQYQAMTQWAAENLSPSEIEAFNANVDSGDPSLTQFAVQGLFARYRSEGASEPQLMQGRPSNNQGGAFNSVAELTAAMSDPRYHNDPAYRQSVAQKLSRSNVF